MIRLCAPVFDAEDRRRIDDVLDSGMLVQGRYVGEFEAALAARLGCEVVACNSGTAALHLALLALGVGPGDEVLVPAFTWPSSAHVIVHVGATPVFVDIDPDTLAMRPDAALAAATERTRAVMPVHLFGLPCPMRALRAAAAERGWHVIEDAACALGTTLDDGTHAGLAGDIGCFSLHPRKIVTTGEGGFCTTSDRRLADGLRAFRNHGMVRGDDSVRFEHFGLNYRMPELSGALGVGQAAQLDGILASRRALARTYLEALDELDAVEVPAGLCDPGAVHQSFVVYAPDAATRATWMAGLREADVETTIGTYAVTDQPCYIERFGVTPSDFPNAQRAADSLMTLPLHPGMSHDDVRAVVAALGRLASHPGPA